MKKQIFLIRHGRVGIDHDTPMRYKELQSWLKLYDEVALDPKSTPESTLFELVKEADVILASTLKRTHDSAKILGAEIDFKSPLFDEARVMHLPLPLLKFKPYTWFMILRLLVFGGFGTGEKSYRGLKKSAQSASEHLLSFTPQHDKIVLIGHGGKNWLISKHLQAHGWHLNGERLQKNWGVMHLTLD